MIRDTVGYLIRIYDKNKKLCAGERDCYHLEPENHLSMIGTDNLRFPGAHC
jgi:hypothetical protein